MANPDPAYTTSEDFVHKVYLYLQSQPEQIDMQAIDYEWAHVLIRREIHRILPFWADLPWKRAFGNPIPSNEEDTVRAIAGKVLSEIRREQDVQKAALSSLRYFGQLRRRIPPMDLQTQRVLARSAHEGQFRGDQVILPQ